ncbi:MAG TPA: DUF6677 family protein [Candidatus Acidoferrales bacterium]
MTDKIQTESTIEPASSGQLATDNESAPTNATSHSRAATFALAGWIAPGLGHLLQRSWMKAAAFFVAVAGLGGFGYAMHGAVFAPGSDGPLGTLGFLADVGCGGIYVLSRFLGSAGADLSHATGDYGSRLIAAAGIVNMLAMIDAFETAARRKI